MAEFFFVRQQYARGNGDAVLAAKSFIGDEPCAVLFGDDVVYSENKPAIGQLIEVYERYNDPVIGIADVPHEDVSKYGIIEGVEINDRLTEISTFVEKPKPSETQSTKAVIGKYVITPEVFAELERMKDDVTGELGLDHAFNALLGQKALYGYEIEGVRYDCGDKLGYVQATVEYALRHPVIGQEFREYLKKLEK
jgi:UTP--glucose-1-phosphate uridylyltransferase